jgi:hypothetical protein
MRNGFKVNALQLSMGLFCGLFAFSFSAFAGVQLLLKQSFNDGDFDVSLGTSEWYAVVGENGKYALHKTAVRVFEQRPAEFSFPAQWKMFSDFDGKYLFFLRGLTLQEGPLVAQEVAADGRIAVGASVRLAALNSSLSASGKTNPAAGDSPPRIENYKLTVSTPFGAQDIAEHGSPLPLEYRIYFAGDINRDGLPDLLIDTARQAAGHGRDMRFYLSEKRAGKFALRQVYQKLLSE